MQTEVRRQNIFPLPAAQMWDLLIQTETLHTVADGFVTYHGKMLPEWTEGENFDIKPKFQKFPWSLLPKGSHQVKVKLVDPDRRRIETQESGGVVTRWDHVMTISEFVDSRFCLYADHVIIEAGILTPLVSKLANELYEHRHAKWFEIATALATQK